jgi:hypothetical protein
VTLSPDALLALDAVEAVELRSLEWGFTDGSLSEDEATDLIADALSGARADELLEELIEGRLLVEIQGASGSVRIRSRFAETMRLLAASRQLFPNKPWQSAPRLVADFRVDRRPRRFPRRHRSPAEIEADHGSHFASTALRKDLWQALTNAPGMHMADFQERALLRLAQGGGDEGTIVTAGTGSGKTISFYLPAMMRIGEAISADFWVKAIAIYPRIELLKDQFAEAYRMARAIDAPLAAHGRRPLRIGALFGATPRTARRDELLDRNWARRGTDFICPWLRCPRCDGDLLWRNEDLERERERLCCSNPQCGTEITDSEILLTRRRLQQQPPDVLFTTTEILNQRLSDQWMRHLFGVGLAASRKPLFALLDEVHTYEGATGAQAALTLRRWRHLLDAAVAWVGLSATLGDAARFFADLTGVAGDRVAEVTPLPDEFEESGAEYQVLLRGDPASRASLLSTTIQSAMLLPRTLDPPGQSISDGAFGHRAFLFTDDLDVTNRLFDDLRDAEAYTIFGRPDPARDPLASLRAGGADAALRDVEGQRWRLCEEVGHPLDRRLVIGRTTSQDAGVNQTANVIVATAALEVGFNDPQVGAVIQHKAPRGMASFLQRKGRAGRSRRMRPITLTVLSDYGRDRAFYQAYEQLFDPTLEPQHLPVHNPYILKIHAVFGFIDWLSARTAGAGRAWFWDLLSRPAVLSGPVKQVADDARKLLRGLIDGDEALIDDLRSYLGAALAVSPATVDSLLWEAPRSLLLEAVPTLVRRWFRQWALAFPANGRTLDVQAAYHPLPDFVPRNLFSDLSLPEVRIIVPPATVNHEERIEALPVLQALNQLAPGRVTRRFAFERGALSHWVAVDPSEPVQERRIGDYAEEHEFVGTFRGRCNDSPENDAVPIFRPWQVRLQQAHRSDALPSSNSRLAWESDIEASGEPLLVPVPPRTPLRQHIRAVGFHLHRFRAHVSVRRFARSANANIRTLQDDFPVTIRFTSDDDQPAAIGFELEVDGFHVDLALPVVDVAGSAIAPELQASIRLAYARERFRADPALPGDLNPFQRDWLFQILVSALASAACAADRPLAEVADELLGEDRLGSVLAEVMDTLFGAIPPPPPDDQEGGDEDADGAEGDEEQRGPADGAAGHGGGRLQQALAGQLARREVRDALRAAAARLSEPDEADQADWLRRTVVESLGEAMLQACASSAPRQAMLDSLLVDFEELPEAGLSRIWITESTIGGAGVLQAFAERFSAEPRLFFSALEAALSPTDLELAGGGLRDVVELAVHDPEIAAQMALLRATQSHAERAQHWQVLSRLLASKSAVDLSHALSVSLNSRLLRSGSGPELDELLLFLQEQWDALEQSCRFSLGLREFGYVASQQPAIAERVRAFLASTLPPAALTQVNLVAAVTNLLWPREAEIRQRVLTSYNPYREARTTDPALVRNLLLTEQVPIVDLDDEALQAKLEAAFEAHGLCRIRADAGAAPLLRRTLVWLAATPIDVGYLQFFPAIERIERARGKLVATLALREQT